MWRYPDLDPVNEDELNVDKIKEWQSIVTLIVFVATNLIVLFPFHIPLPAPRGFHNALLRLLSSAKVIEPRQGINTAEVRHSRDGVLRQTSPWIWYQFPMNFLTAPLIADLFLLAIGAIHRQEVHDGTLGADNIIPIDIMAFFLTLAYIAISIDASGLIRYLAFKVLQWGGKVGHRLFLFLYVFFFILGSFIGNDPIILSGTAFLAYMTRVSSNIVHPRAWIYTQFAVANIASAILVSSNPTNLVLAGAFKIRFIDYTVNMIVPVVITGIVLFPFLLYIIFNDEALIPSSIKMHELPEEVRSKKAVNPNIPHARGLAGEEENNAIDDNQTKLLSLEEIMNPFLDKKGALFGGLIMAAALITMLVLNATGHEYPIFYITVPAAFVMFCWEVFFGWLNRKETREIARKGRLEVEEAHARRRAEEEEIANRMAVTPDIELEERSNQSEDALPEKQHDERVGQDSNNNTAQPDSHRAQSSSPDVGLGLSVQGEGSTLAPGSPQPGSSKDLSRTNSSIPPQADVTAGPTTEKIAVAHETEVKRNKKPPRTLVSTYREVYIWCSETFPTVTAVVAHLPFALVPFAFTMFILVQALVTKGWVPVFAHGWDHWVRKTGTVGAVGGMGFLSVILCNFAGTNIGTTILLSRVIQVWRKLNAINEIDISDRTFWATVYSMAIGVNYGAFSTAFSASLAGLLWRDILARKHIHVRRLDFARVNLPIIAIAMVIGCAVLIGEVYIMRGDEPYKIDGHG